MTPRQGTARGPARTHLPQFRLLANSARAGPGAAPRRGRGARRAARVRGARTPPGCLLGPGVDAAEITSWKIPLSEVSGEGRRRQEAPGSRGAGQSHRRRRLREQPRGDPAPPPPAPPRDSRAPRPARTGRGSYRRPRSRSQGAPIAARRAPPRGGARRARGGRRRRRAPARSGPGSEQARSGPRPAPPRCAGRPSGQ